MAKKLSMHWHRDTTLTSDAPTSLPRLRFRDLRGRDVVVIGEALLLLPAIQLAVRLAGLRQTAEWASRLGGWRVGTAPPNFNTLEIERIALLIRGSCRRWPFRATCLDRSLVTVAVLGRRRVPVTFNVGFRKGDLDLEGHAWVEHNALPLAETTDLTEMSRQVFAWRGTLPPRQAARQGHTVSSKSPG